MEPNWDDRSTVFQDHTSLIAIKCRLDLHEQRHRKTLSATFFTRLKTQLGDLTSFWGKRSFNTCKPILAAKQIHDLLIDSHFRLQCNFLSFSMASSDKLL